MKQKSYTPNSSLLYKGYSKIPNLTWFSILLLFIFAGGCKKVTEVPGTTGICPTVVSTSPAAGATNVVTNSKVTATFNEAMNPATINTTTFILKQGATQIAGTVTYTGMTATFTPATLLAANTVYTGTITTGSKDPQNNAMVADYVWSFNTGNIPTVISTDPVNGASSVPFNKLVTATFSTTMNPATINSTTYILKQGATVVPGTVTYSGSTATFTPTSPLAANTVYTGLITTGAQDVAGNALAANYTWSFSTGGVPTVISTDPVNGATGVALSKIVTATFSTTMDPTTINSISYVLKQGATVVPGVVTYSGSTASFTPSAPLAANTVYTGLVTTAAKDASGNALAANYTWSFTTSSAPTVVATDPLNGAINVALNKIITATFSTVMDPLTINASSFLLKQGATAVSGIVNYSGSTASFTPTAPLAANTVYTASITTAAKDLAGNPLAIIYTWSFTTSNSPSVVSTDPANGATGVALNKIITANFNMQMDPTTITGLSFLVKQGLTTIFGTVTYSGFTATFTPAIAFSQNAVYTATITTSAKSASGNALASNYVWSFTTLSTSPVAPIMGTMSTFGAFGGSAGVTNQGLFTVINNGGIGTTAVSTAVTGFHDGLTADVYTETPLNVGNVTGGIFTAPPFPGTATSFAKATQALIDATAAYNSISPASKPGGTDPGAGELGGLTLAPGVYKAAGGTFKITNGDLTLDAMGDPNAVWIFQTAAGLTVGIAGPAGARNVKMINGGQPKNVYWYVGSSATINGAGGGVMSGTIIAMQGVTFSTAGNAVQTVLNGRAISLVASVTMVNTTVNVQ